VRDLARRHALANLLLDVGKHCLAASDPSALAASALAAVVPALGAGLGWLGFTDPAGAEHVFDSKGRAPDAASVAALARVMGLAASDGTVVPLDVPAGTGLRVGAEGRRGLFTPFSVGDGRRGFLLVLGADARGLPPGAEDVLAPAGAYVGLTVSRLGALARLRDANTMLERKVEERTTALRRERDSLEDRVRERTRELEAAKRSTVEAERRLLDRERGEVARRLAAGLAHEVNNPVGAARANLDHAVDVLRGLLPAIDSEPRSDAADALEAIEDARRDIDRVAKNVRSLFEDAATSRLAAVRTPLGPVVRDAVAAHASGHPGSPSPVLVERDGVACGVSAGECSRWLFRLLGVLARARATRLRVEVGRFDGSPGIAVEASPAVDLEDDADLDALRDEIRAAGARVDVEVDGERSRAVLGLPRAVGEAAGVVVEGTA
jgi:signal transduction histidine kinase